MALQATSKKFSTTLPILRMIHISSSSNALPTDFFQKSLPKLPITSLEQAMASFLNVRKAVLEPNQYKELEGLANTFMQGNGKTLHEDLVHSYNQGDLTKYGWDQEIPHILSCRDMAFYQDGGSIISDFGKNESQCVRASKVIHCAAKINIALRNNAFSPTVWNYSPLFEGVLKETEENFRTQVSYGLGMIPLNMGTHLQGFFGSARIPCLNIDSARINNTSKNIVIIRNGHLFTFDVMSDSGEVISIDEIFSALTKIKEQSTIPSPSPVAALTCLDRTSWAKHRNHLLTDQHNSELLKIVEESILVFTLDGQFEKERIGKNIHLGKNAGDRWLDKGAFSSIAESSPYTAFCGNVAESHASAGGDFAHSIIKDYKKCGMVDVSGTTDSPSLEQLHFNIDEFTESGIKNGKKVFNKFYSEFQYEEFEIPEVTNTEFKKRFLNPSSMILLAAQISFMKMYGRPHVIDAVTMLPLYINGNIKLHKSPSPLMANLAKNFAHGKKMDMALLRRYSDAYYSEILQMRMGLRLDGTLLAALEQLSEERGYKCDFFSSELYQKQLERLYVVTIPHHVAKNVVYCPDADRFGMSYLFGRNGISGNMSAVDSPDGAPVKEYCRNFLETMNELINFISNQK